MESTAGAHRANAAASGECELFYRRERNREVDFVTRAGVDAFADSFKSARRFLVGGDGIALQDFLAKPVAHWVKAGG